MTTFWEKIYAASIGEAKESTSLHEEGASLSAEEVLEKMPLLKDCDRNKLKFCLKGEQIAKIASLSSPKNQDIAFLVESMTLEQFRQFLLSLPTQEFDAKKWMALAKIYPLFESYRDWLSRLYPVCKERIVQLEHTLDLLEKSNSLQGFDDTKSQIELFASDVKNVCKECTSALTLLWTAENLSLIETIGFYKEMLEDALLAIGEEDDLTNKTLYGTLNFITQKNRSNP